MSRGKELGHTVSIDACHWKRNGDGREAIIVNTIDEGSRFHVALVLIEIEEIGNLTTMDYIEAVRMNWFRFAKAPVVIRVDSENAFKSHESLEWCAARRIEFQMSANDANWQIGIVESHLRLLKNQLSLMEDKLPDASIDELVEHCVAAKVRRQTFDGYYPLQWWFGTQYMDLEKIDQALNDDWNFRHLPKPPLFVSALGRPCTWPSMRDNW